MLKLCSFFLLILLSANCWSWIGNGTEENPYQIITVDDLSYLSEQVENGNDYYGQFFILMNDIDLGVYPWNYGDGWLPIGGPSSSFSGSFDGSGFCISNLYIERETSNHGLFGNISYAEIKRLNLANVYITSGGITGGIVGYNNYSIIDDCSCTGIIHGVDNVGGLVGYSDGSTISNSYSLCDVNGNTSLGGISGRIHESTLLNCFYDYETVLINDQHLISPGALESTMFNVWLANDKLLDINEYLTTDGQNYLIEDFNDLNIMMAFCQSPDITFLLMNDIDLSEHDNFYIPYLGSVFDGNLHRISNLYIDISEFRNLGLFGYISGAEIRNIGSINVHIDGNGFTGGVVGNSYNSTISNSFSTGNVDADYYCAGGLAGSQNDSYIMNSFSLCDVYGRNDSGGFIGSSHNSTISDCYCMGDVTGINEVGGFSGMITYSYISGCFSAGSVAQANDSAGFVGNGYSNVVYFCYWNTETSGYDVGNSYPENEGFYGRTTDEMTYPYAENTYVGLDFDEVWASDNDYIQNNGYPYLQGLQLVEIGDTEQIINEYQFSICNYPNPFNPETTITYNLPSDSKITLSIHNIKGQLVKELINDKQKSGIHSIVWNGKDQRNDLCSSGVYFYSITSDNLSKTGKMILLK